MQVGISPLAISQRIEDVYQYLRRIGIDGNEANFLITEDLRLVEKNNFFIRSIHWLAAKIGLFDPKKEPTYIPAVINNLSCYLADSPELTAETEAHAQFIKETLRNIQSRKDPHLEKLKELNRTPDPVTQQQYVAGDLPRPDTQSAIDKAFNFFWPAPNGVGSHIALLPTDLRKEIFKYLTHSELAKTRLVCTQWKRECEDKNVWQAVLKQPAFARLRATFQANALFPQALHAHYLATRSSQFVSWPTGRSLQLVWNKQLLGGTPEAFCIRDNNSVYIQKGDQKIVLSGHANSFTYANETLYSVTAKEIKRWNPRTLEEGSFPLQLAAPVRSYSIENEFVNIIAENRICRFNTKESVLTPIENSMDFQDPVMLDHYCFEKVSQDNEIQFIDLLAPEKGPQCLINTHQSRVGTVKNGMAYVIQGHEISLYDLEKRTRIEKYAIHVTPGSTIIVEEGLLILKKHNPHAGEPMYQAFDIARKREEPLNWFPFESVVSLQIKKRNIFYLTIGGDLKESNLLFSQRDGFELRSLLPTVETVDAVVTVAGIVTAVAGIVLTAIGVPTAVYYAAEAERAGRGNIFTKSIVVLGEFALVVLYIILQILDAQNGRRHRAF